MHRAPFFACIYGAPTVDRMVFSLTVMEQAPILSIPTYMHSHIHSHIHTYTHTAGQPGRRGGRRCRRSAATAGAAVPEATTCEKVSHSRPAALPAGPAKRRCWI